MLVGFSSMLLVACAGTPDGEDSSDAEGVAATAGADGADRSGAAGDGSGADGSGTGDAAQAGVDEVTPFGEEGSAAADPLEDPDSPLAERVIYFDFDRSDIRSEFLRTITAHARYLVENPEQRVRLEGHTDERGSREYNIALGERRAQAVRRVFLFQGVRAQQIDMVSYGEERPQAEGHDEEAWGRNRRVEIIYLD